MFKVSDEYKKEINKLGGRSFVSKVLIRDKRYNDDLIIDMSLEESVNPGDNFSLGSVVSNSFNINLFNLDEYEIFDNATVKPYIGLKIDRAIEYIPLGIYTVSNVTNKNKKVKLECVDNMIKLEGTYFSELSYPANINAVLKEICSKAKITCNSTLPNYSIEEIKGYSLRQAVGIIATLCGCFAKFNRIGELEISTYKDEGLKITPDIFFTFENNDKEYTIEKITAKRGEKTFSKGADIGREIQIDNPVITEDILNDLYTKYKDFSYMPYSLKWQGNPVVQAGDRVTIVGLDGKVYNTLIMEHKLTYKGSISSEIKATGKTKAESKFDRKGSITQAMENYAIEQATIKKALIDKADINELNALNGKIQILYTEDLTGIRADIKTIKTKDLTALESKLTHALIGKADVNELNVAVERVGILEGKTLSVENQLAGNLTAKNFHANAITAGSGIIAEGAIGSAQISSLSVNKLEAGEFITSKHKIISADGTIEIVGNQILINRDNINRVVLGEYRKQDNTTDYGLLIRAKDGKTVMFDSEGVHNAGITNGSIDNNKVSDNANIAGNKLDINSVIREVNNGTETIKGTKVTVGDRTLDVELSTQKNIITEHGKELSTQKASIQALDNIIKLKVDNQTFTQATSTINSNINNALNSAKEFTTAQIRTTNSNLSKATSEINILKEQINTKVGQVEIDKSIKSIEIGGRNLVLNSNLLRFDANNIGLGTSTLQSDGTGKFYRAIPASGKAVSLYYFCTGNRMSEQLITDRKTLYSMSLDVRVPKNSVITRFNFENEKWEKVTLLKDKWTRIKLEGFTLPSTTNKALIIALDTSIDVYLDYRNLKIEKGTKCSEYTQAPEDTDKLIIDNIKVVTDKINDVSTKLVQSKDSLQASVNSLNSTTQTITTNLTNKINTAKTDAINSAKTYTNAQITTVNTRVSNAESSINILKNQISTKVSQTDVENTVINYKTNNYGYLYKKNIIIKGDINKYYPVIIKGGDQNVKRDIFIQRWYSEKAPVEWNPSMPVHHGGLSLLINTNFGGWGGIDYSWSIYNLEEMYCRMFAGATLCADGMAFAIFLRGGGETGASYNFYSNQPLEKDLYWDRTDIPRPDKLQIAYNKDLIYYSVQGSNTYTGYAPAPRTLTQEVENEIKNKSFIKLSQNNANDIIVTQNKINTVESTLTQKTNSINAEVSSVQSILKTKADGSTVSSIQSQLASLNIGVNGIKLEVSKKVNKDSIISAINQSAEEITIDASRIKLNGLTTFARNTGLKAIQIDGNIINFYDWEGSERRDNVGTIYSTRMSSDSKRVGLSIGHERNAVFNIIYKSKEKEKYYSYIEFDKHNIDGNKCPINIYEDVCLKGSEIFLANRKVNSLLENTNEEFLIKAKHGVQITDTDTGKITAALGSDKVGFSKWNQNYYYAEFYPGGCELATGNGGVYTKFFPGGFSLASGSGKSYFWADAGSSDIWTAPGVNMRIQGALSVNGSKNRIVETKYGDLALNAIESTECWFTDIGIEQNRTDNNGDCIIWFDNKFLSTVNTRYKYKIDVTPIGEFASNGKLTYVRVVEKTEKYFKVRGTPNTLFDWTITAKQKGYERDRLEVMKKAS